MGERLSRHHGRDSADAHRAGKRAAGERWDGKTGCCGRGETMGWMRTQQQPVVVMGEEVAASLVDATDAPKVSPKPKKAGQCTPACAALLQKLCERRRGTKHRKKAGLGERAAQSRSPAACVWSSVSGGSRLFAWMLDGNGTPSCSLSLSSISLLALDAGEPEPAPVRIGNGLKKLGAPRPPSRWIARAVRDYAVLILYLIATESTLRGRHGPLPHCHGPEAFSHPGPARLRPRLSTARLSAGSLLGRSRIWASPSHQD